MSYRSNSRDIFEHAVATTMRAIAYDNAVEMSITTGEPNVSSLQERVSRLPQKVHSIDIAAVRGTADSLALKHRYHDPDIHVSKHWVLETCRVYEQTWQLLLKKEYSNLVFQSGVIIVQASWLQF